MKKNTKIFEAVLLCPNLFKMKELRIATYFLILLTTMFMGSCAKNDEITSSESSFGVWQRYGSPRGYNTDLAVGNIPGEPTNRVYMCEHPGSPTAGLYKGYINGNIITWDASHGLPNAEFKEVGSERTLYFGVGAVADAGKYRKGVWTNTCGELKYIPKNVYYRWTNSSTCPLPSDYIYNYKHPDLPSTLNINQQYGPIAAGSVEIILNDKNGSYLNHITLSPPPTGYKRIYTNNVYQFNTDVNRCLSYLTGSGLTYVDLPL
jgi:hypothetical protein